ncbi:MAG TPA: ribulose-phosphate 3-epimerase [Saprospiraceae bacterium]|nr:ribulose-phosphate 3-epimerase [Saprospiraceae bacterium]
MKTKKIAPSLLSADFAHLERDIRMLEQAGADILHFDVMDGQFVPNISIGIPVLKAVRRVTSLPIDVHLMIETPGLMVDAFVDAGADNVTIHFEAERHLHKVVHQIKAKGAQVGVAINPHTPVSVLEDILPDLDLVLVMSVNPGFGGQSFIPNTLDKLSRLRKIRDERDLSHIDIEVDGGVKIDNIKAIADAGADILVSGSGIFRAKNPAQMIHEMKALINS